MYSGRNILSKDFFNMKVQIFRKELMLYRIKPDAKIQALVE
jgi:hypothetical protein